MSERFLNLSKFFGKVERRESLPRPLGKITLVRHQATLYTESGDDLTNEGIAGARRLGEWFKATGFFNDSYVRLISAPAARTRATLKYIMEGAGLSGDVEESKDIRKSDFRNFDKFIERAEELGNDQEAVAKDHHENEEFYENSPEIIEPISEKRTRLYKWMGDVVDSILTAPKTGQTPHVLAVSHFEIITLLLHDAFGITNLERYQSPAFGEYTHLEMHETDSPNEVLFNISFRNVSTRIIFDRKTQTVRTFAD